MKKTLFTVSLNKPLIAFPSLPGWMHLDKKNGNITIEAKTQSNIGTFNIYVAFSTKVKRKAFTFIQKDDELRDLFVLLLSCGYIDSEYFLTPNFHPTQPLILNSHYRNMEESIRGVLSNSYFEIVSRLFVEPSLLLRYNDSLLIETPSYHSLSVSISLGQNKDKIKPILLTRHIQQKPQSLRRKL